VAEEKLSEASSSLIVTVAVAVAPTLAPVPVAPLRFTVKASVDSTTASFHLTNYLVGIGTY